MKFAHTAVWLLGPAGSGKSTLSRQLVALGFESIDQDRVAVALMREAGLPLDTRTHDPLQARAFARLRDRVADQVWEEVKQIRRSGRPLVYEATGNKPDYLEVEVVADRAAGYRAIALGLATSLDLCLQRNARRERVLLPELVASTWQDFRRGVGQGVYARIFGSAAFALTDDPQFDVVRWMVARTGGGSGLRDAQSGVDSDD